MRAREKEREGQRERERDRERETEREREKSETRQGKTGARRAITKLYCFYTVLAAAVSMEDG